LCVKGNKKPARRRLKGMRKNYCSAKEINRKVVSSSCN
jgi:hypothetical protein